MENPEGGDSPPPPDLLGSRASPLAAAGAPRTAPLAAAGALRSAPLAAGAPRSAPLAAAGALRSAPQHAAAAPSSPAAGALRLAAGAFVAAGASSSTSAAAPMFAAPDLGSGHTDPAGFPPLIPLVPPPAAGRGPLAAGRPPLNLQAAAGALPATAGAAAAADLGDGKACPSSAGGLGAGQGPAQPAAPSFIAAADQGGAKGAQQPSSPSDGAQQHSWAQGAPSFAQLFAKPPPQVAIPVRVHAPAATDSGKPAAFFAVEEVHISCSPLDFAIVAKTPQGRPPFPIIRAHLAQRFNLLKDFLITPYDGRHLIIKLGCREDYIKMLLKATVSVQGLPFWFSKWTLKFSPNVDSPLVPVWIELPRLPLNFYFEPMLRSIAGSIGSVLHIAQCTLDMSRAHAAVVCVQIDVSQPLPDQVWIGIGGDGFWQPIEYPSPPRFCSECLRLGHLAPDCKKGTPPTDFNGVPPSDTYGHSKGVARGNEQDRNTPTPNAIWRPVAEKPAAAKPARLNAQGKNVASKVFDKLPEHGSTSDPKVPAAEVQARGVYLTPPKPPHQMRTPGVPAKISISVVSAGGGSSADQQKQKQPPHQVAASQVFDGLSQSLDQLSLKEKAPGSSVRRSRGLSPHLNPAAAAWSPSVHDRGDIDLPDELPPTLPFVARNEQTQISARGKEPELSTTQPQETDFISLQTTYDVMTFPGLPELPDDVPPKIHMRGRQPPSVSQKGGAAQLVDKEFSEAAAQGSGEASPHTTAAGKESSADPTPSSRGRVSFATAIRKKLRASDTRRTERALEDSEEPSSGSSSEEEEPDPPPPPPKVSDWVQAAAPGKMIIGLPATQKEVEPSKLPGKDEEIPQMPVRQTRQTLRRGFL